MAHSGTTVTKPVSFADVNAVLGKSHTTLSALCQDPSIKKWAKWKPIPYRTSGILSDSVRRSNNYGLMNIPTWSNINKMSNFWFGIDTSSTNYPDCGIQSVYWGYRSPAGGVAEPFRLADFVNESGTDGYYHGAEPPIGGSESANYTIDSSGNLTLVFKYGAQSSGTIALSDLVYPRVLSYSVGNMHLGVMLRNKSTGTRYAVTRTDTISSGITNISISGLSSTFNGTYQIFPFLSSEVISFTSNLGQLTNGDFIALHDVEEVGIGATVVKFDILSFWALRDTSQSRRLLYLGTTVKNINSPQRSATISFEVFDVNNNSLATNTVNVSGVSIGDTYYYDGSIDMSTLSNLQNAFTVRAIVTPTLVSNYATSSAVATVTSEPTPEA